MDPSPQSLSDLRAYMAASQGTLDAWPYADWVRELEENEVLTAFQRANTALKLQIASETHSVQVIRAAATDPERHVHMAVVENPATPPDLLMAFAQHWDDRVRAAVASNPSTPLEALLTLSKDTDAGVRCHLATNRQAPLECLNPLSKDTFSIRKAVAENPSTPPALLVTLSKDYYSQVQLAALNNPSLPAETLGAFAEHWDNAIREIVASNPSTPTPRLRLLAMDRSVNVRQRVAANPNTSADTLSILARDVHAKVCIAAVQHPSAPLGAKARCFLTLAAAGTYQALVFQPLEQFHRTFLEASPTGKRYSNKILLWIRQAERNSLTCVALRLLVVAPISLLAQTVMRLQAVGKSLRILSPFSSPKRP